MLYYLNLKSIQLTIIKLNRNKMTNNYSDRKYTMLLIPKFNMFYLFQTNKYKGLVNNTLNQKQTKLLPTMSINLRKEK